jgi:nitrogen regulatory protein PII 2
MKEVLAVIRANRINQTKSALVDAGLPAFTGMAALGRGRRPVEFEIIEAINNNPTRSAEILPTLSQGSRLIPKRLVSLVVPDHRVPDVVQLLIKTNKTGKPGDGKIFVLPVGEVYRVRTGETGEQAIDEMFA